MSASLDSACHAVRSPAWPKQQTRPACSSSLYFLDTAARSYKGLEQASPRSTQQQSFSHGPCLLSPGSVATGMKLHNILWRCLAHKGALFHFAHFDNQQSCWAVGTWQYEAHTAQANSHAAAASKATAEARSSTSYKRSMSSTNVSCLFLAACRWRSGYFENNLPRCLERIAAGARTS